jgi:hydrogenase expression/formation protein HypE
VLNELAMQSDTGIEIFQKDIPVSEQVEGACEMLGLDPLYVANEGIFIAVVMESKADQALEILKLFDPTACVIGLSTQDHPRQVIQHSRIGGKRIVSMLPGEQLPRIC